MTRVERENKARIARILKQLEEARADRDQLRDCEEGWRQEVSELVKENKSLKARIERLENKNDSFSDSLTRNL